MFFLIQIWLIKRYCKTSSIKHLPRINGLQELEKLINTPMFIRSDTVTLNHFGTTFFKRSDNNFHNYFWTFLGPYCNT